MTTKYTRTRPVFSHLGIFSRVVLAVATICTLTGTAIMVVEGLSRFFLSVSYFWAEEAVRFLLVWAFFLTLGIAGFKQFHIRTELFVMRLSSSFQRVTWVIASVAGIIFSCILGYSSLDQVKRYYTMGMLSESNLELPMWIVFLAMPVGGLALLVYYLYALWYSIFWGDPFEPEPVTADEFDEATIQALTAKGS